MSLVWYFRHRLQQVNICHPALSGLHENKAPSKLHLEVRSAPPCCLRVLPLSTGMKQKVNPGVLPGFANLTHPRIFTAAELESYLDSVFGLKRSEFEDFHKELSFSQSGWTSWGRQDLCGFGLSSNTFRCQRCSWRLGSFVAESRSETSLNSRSIKWIVLQSDMLRYSNYRIRPFFNSATFWADQILLLRHIASVSMCLQAYLWVFLKVALGRSGESFCVIQKSFLLPAFSLVVLSRYSNPHTGPAKAALGSRAWKWWGASLANPKWTLMYRLDELRPGSMREEALSPCSFWWTDISLVGQGMSSSPTMLGIAEELPNVFVSSCMWLVSSRFLKMLSSAVFDACLFRVSLLEETLVEELLLESGSTWAMGESPETQAILAEHLRHWEAKGKEGLSSQFATRAWNKRCELATMVWNKACEPPTFQNIYLQPRTSQLVSTSLRIFP